MSRESAIRLVAASIAMASLVACVDGDEPVEEKSPSAEEVSEGEGQGEELPFASEVIDFSPGSGAGFGVQSLPGVVLGPPKGKGTNAGSLDVLSLGVGGEITLGFGDRVIADGPGADFIVFENPFWPMGDQTQVFAEFGAVEVSEDGETWYAFGCDVDVAVEFEWPGCAGWSPTLAFDASQEALTHDLAGGDAFDLADVGLERARFVRVRDLAQEGQAPSAGFDLDAVGVIHFEDGAR